MYKWNYEFHKEKGFLFPHDVELPRFATEPSEYCTLPISGEVMEHWHSRNTERTENMFGKSRNIEIFKG
jgi:hypothetical protein